MAIHKQCERMPGFLETDIKYLKGVGDARAKVLASELGVATFRDLLYYFPFRHIDRSRFYSIGELSGSDLPALQIKGRFIKFATEGDSKNPGILSHCLCIATSLTLFQKKRRYFQISRICDLHIVMASLIESNLATCGLYCRGIVGEHPSGNRIVGRFQH